MEKPSSTVWCLLRTNGGFAGRLRKPRHRQTAEHQWNAAVAIEKIGQRVTDALLIASGTRWHGEV
jgi:hypothetical protein